MADPITITYCSETHTIPKWAEITGLSESCIRKRMKDGWTPKEILTTVPQNKAGERIQRLIHRKEQKEREEFDAKDWEDIKERVKNGECPQRYADTHGAAVRCSSGCRFGW